MFCSAACAGRAAPEMCHLCEEQRLSTAGSSLAVSAYVPGGLRRENPADVEQGGHKHGQSIKIEKLKI